MAASSQADETATTLTPTAPTAAPPSTVAAAEVPTALAWSQDSDDVTDVAQRTALEFSRPHVEYGERDWDDIPPRRRGPLIAFGVSAAGDVARRRDGGHYRRHACAPAGAGGAAPPPPAGAPDDHGHHHSNAHHHDDDAHYDAHHDDPHDDPHVDVADEHPDVDLDAGDDDPDRSRAGERALVT
ncbi:MAG: hypothetical protein QOI25_5433 [Mycobacterium sp.]|jgi:hypothetical protein|nr:hypothetical protein [Mycobacterium sp.]